MKDALSGEVDEHSPKPIPASVVLAQWYTDERYCDENGAPRELTFDEGEPSFTSLVREYAGDIPPGAIRTELVRVGSVEVTEKGNIIPLRRYYLPAEGSDRLLRALERPLPLLLQNIRQNNLRPPLPRDHLTWPEMVVQIDKINPTMRIELRDFAYKKITEFAEDMDDCLSEFRAANQSNTQEELSVGVGFYYFEVR